MTTLEFLRSFEEVLVLVGLAALCLIAAVAAVVYLINRAAMSTPATPPLPFWRRDVTQRLSACAIVALLLVAVL